MNFLITFQYNFPKIDYNWTGGSGKTVKSSGCGPCSMLMILENMLGQRWSMAAWIDWVLATGARVNGGTDMGVLGREVAENFNLDYTVTSSEKVLKKHLQDGGMAVANVGGERSGWPGIFSTRGHFVTVLGLTADGRFIIGDPNFYSGKFSGSFRRNRVQVDGEVVYINADNLHLDTIARTPNYHLFKLKENPITEEETEVRYKTFDELPNWSKEAVQYYIDEGKLKGTSAGVLDLSEDMVRLLVIQCPTVYETVEEVPLWARPTVEKLIAEGALKGDGNGLGLTLDLLRAFVVDETSLA